MRINTFTNTSVFQLSTMVREQSASRRLALPVDSSLVLYSRFKHVHGTPSMEDGTGLPLSSLRAMDNLIDRLVAIRGRNTYSGSVEGLSSNDIGFVVEELQRELNGKVAGEELPLTAGSAQNDLGLMLNFVA
jgi:hypothetical protein